MTSARTSGSALAITDRRAVSAEPGLEPRVERVTLTPTALEPASHVVFLAVGAEKAGPVARALAGRASWASEPDPLEKADDRARRPRRRGVALTVEPSLYAAGAAV
jgi:Glucosamine-6-phosphate isomerases/6-phosphogluconolactonase